MSKQLIAFFVHPVVMIAAATTAVSAATQNTKANNGESALIGYWRGDSICVVRESACRDEDSLYHLYQDPKKPGWFLLEGNKIVDGKPVTMGTAGCSYDAKTHTLECAMPPGGVTRLVVEGTDMRGTMTLADKTEWRKITLKKVRPEDAR